VSNTTAFNINHCVFRNNQATSADFGGAAVAQNYGTSMIQNSLFHNNTMTSFSGGALGHRRGTLTVYNCTFMNNSAGGSGDDVSTYAPANGGATTIRNSILWSSTSPLFESGSATVEYSNTRGGAHAGTGNINSSPAFANAANNEFELAVGSASLDVGTSSGAPADDLVGDSRPQDDDGDTTPEYDLGAYEGGVTTTTTTSTTSTTTSSTSSTSTTSTTSTTAPLIVPQTLFRFD
jgi:hypothetical protein